MVITITQFRKNPGKYLKTLFAEDVLITKHGKIVARLTNYQEELEALKQLVDIAKGEEDLALEQIKKERLSKKYLI